MTDRLFDFSGKVALITGGSRGMGYEMAKAFAERGADIVVTSRKLDTCQAVAAEIESMGRKALAYGCNVARWDDLPGLVDAAYAAFGKIDILVNNAGSSPLAPSSLETSEQLFDRIVHLNFKGPFRLMSLVGSRMVEGDGGSIINISSVGAIRPRPSIAPYAGAKAALNAITTAFAFEYGPKVRVNAIMPGRFLTDISKAWTEEARQNVGVALHRSGKPEEIVTAALYLASDHSGFTTGSVIQVDGGIA
ncbi:MAG: SDR family oxidoreductase [Alphaproteobacteria bacterium]|nr:SDR family oxidoreductase [Alphaproteobacteria bacterium]